MSDFSVIRDSGQRSVLHVAGDVDLSVAQRLIEEALHCLGDSGIAPLALDLEQVSFMDSSGLSALVLIRNAAARAGRSVTLVNIPPKLQRLLTLSALDTLFAPPISDL